MAAVWEQRFAEYVRRVLALRESTALEALPDLMPVLPVIDPSSPEQGLSRRERSFMQSVSQAAGGAGQHALIQLGNGSGSNRLAVIDRILLHSATAQEVELHVLTGWTTAASSSSVRDIRGGSVQGTVNAVTGTIGAAPTVYPMRIYVPANGPDVVVEPGFVLPPNGYCRCYAGTANTNLVATFLWRERAIEGGAELNPTGA